MTGWRLFFARNLPVVGAALPILILLVVGLSIILAAAGSLGLSPAETSTWIFLLYGPPGLLTMVFSFLYRQPLIFTGNIFAVIFIASLGSRLSYPELAGASLLAGAVVLGAGILGLTGRLAARIPGPIVSALIAGAVLPFVWGVFAALNDLPMVVGSALLAYLLSRRLLSPRLPAIFAALIVGLVAAAVTGGLGEAPPSFSLPAPTLVRPEFSLAAILSATPVFVVLITATNLPSIVFLRGQGYLPPDRAVDVASGAGTLFGSALGPIAVSVPIPLTALAAGPGAGDLTVRARVGYMAGAGFLLIALLAAIAADVTALVPLGLLLALAGLSVVGVLASALEEMVRGPLLLGPLFAFAVALSDLALFGLGTFFWSPVIGTAVSLLLERDAWRCMRADAQRERESQAP